MADYKITMKYDPNTKKLTDVEQDIPEALQIGDTIEFVSDVGDPIIAFHHGSPFSKTEPIQMIRGEEGKGTTGPRTVENLPRFHFSCGIKLDGKEIFSSQAGAETPIPGGK